MQMVRKKKKKPSTSYTNSFWADSFSYQPTQRGLEKKKKTAVLLFQKKNCHTLVLAEDERRKQG